MGTLEELGASYARLAHARETRFVVARSRANATEVAGLAGWACERAGASDGLVGAMSVHVLDVASVRVADLPALAGRAASQRRALVADNTLPTACGCSPLALGAQVCLEELGRLDRQDGPSVLCAVSVGPSRVRGRARACDPQLASSVLEAARAHDAGLSAAELAWLEGRVEGLGARVRAANDAAMAAAEYLRCHPLVSRVLYPGLPDAPDHELAASELRFGFGPVVGFDLVGSAGALRAHGRFVRQLGATCASRAFAVREAGDSQVGFRLFVDPADDAAALVGALEAGLR